MSGPILAHENGTRRATERPDRESAAEPSSVNSRKLSRPEPRIECESPVDSQRGFVGKMEPGEFLSGVCSRRGTAARVSRFARVPSTAPDRLTALVADSRSVAVTRVGGGQPCLDASSVSYDIDVVGGVNRGLDQDRRFIGVEKLWAIRQPDIPSQHVRPCRRQLAIEVNDGERVRGVPAPPVFGGIPAI